MLILKAEWSVNISLEFCYVLQLSMEQSSSMFGVSVLCVLVLSFILGNYVPVVRWFLCPGCLAPCNSQVLLHDKCQIQCLVFHVCHCLGECGPYGNTFLPWDMTCCMFVCCSYYILQLDLKLFIKEVGTQEGTKWSHCFFTTICTQCTELMHCYGQVASQRSGYDVWML